MEETEKEAGFAVPSALEGAKEDCHSIVGERGWWSDQGPESQFKRMESHGSPGGATVSLGAALVSWSCCNK